MSHLGWFDFDPVLQASYGSEVFDFRRGSFYFITDPEADTGSCGVGFTGTGVILMPG